MHGEDRHRGRSPQAVGHDRGRRRARDSAGRRAGSATDKAGYAAMRKHVAAWPERIWAVEGSNGAGRSLAQRLLADGEHVVDVPAKLAARARMLDTGHGRKTDAHDAHSVAVAAVRAKELRVLAHDPELEALRMLVDRRDELVRAADPDRQPAAAAAGRTHPGQGEEGHHHRAGQGDPRLGASPRPGRQDPPPARGRAAGRAGRGREEDQGARPRSSRRWSRPVARR